MWTPAGTNGRVVGAGWAGHLKPILTIAPLEGNCQRLVQENAVCALLNVCIGQASDFFCGIRRKKIMQHCFS